MNERLIGSTFLQRHQHHLKADKGAGGTNTKPRESAQIDVFHANMILYMMFRIKDLIKILTNSFYHIGVVQFLLLSIM